ncbi:hypothetical protein [Niallia circulans]|uniref:hypothetical protein n=1 Tax=Niallia circulans TaxID=1397 RepID=UPI000A5CA88F|nr:hypothetical protein [Niallia circulans]MED5102758.1 hypothetical protein [Niallia circulans]
MSLKLQQLYNILIIVLSWLSLTLIGVRDIKRFFPATLIIGVIEISTARIGKNESGGLSIINQILTGLTNYHLIWDHLSLSHCGP